MIKRQLQLCLPGVRVFLDGDNEVAFHCPMVEMSAGRTFLRNDVEKEARAVSFQSDRRLMSFHII